MEPLDQITFNVTALDDANAIRVAERLFNELQGWGNTPFDIMDSEAVKDFDTVWANTKWRGDWVVTITYKKRDKGNEF